MSATDAERADWIERVLGFAIPDNLSRPGSAPLDAWLRAKQLLDGQIGALQKAFGSIDHPLAKRIVDRGLSAFSGRLQVGLQVALMEYQSGTEDQRPARAKNVLAATARCPSWRPILWA